MKHNDWLKQQLQDDTFAAAYLTEAAMDLEPRVFTAAMRHVIDARGGLVKVAEAGGLSRQSLYRAFAPTGNPTARTLFAAMRAAGLQLQVAAPKPA
jgi:probable addiction module antidote protein